MGMPGPQKINRYGLEFKLGAVRTSEQPGVLVKDVAESPCIHPFMLSKWRKQARDGVLSGKSPALDAAAVAELQQLREVEGKYLAAADGARPAKKCPVCLRSKGEVFAFIEADRQAWPVAMICRQLGVTRAGYYAWQARGPSRRELDGSGAR